MLTDPASVRSAAVWRARSDGSEEKVSTAWVHTSAMRARNGWSKSDPSGIIASATATSAADSAPMPASKGISETKVTSAPAVSRESSWRLIMVQITPPMRAAHEPCGAGGVTGRPCSSMLGCCCAYRSASSSSVMESSICCSPLAVVANTRTWMVPSVRGDTAAAVRRSEIPMTTMPPK